MKNNRLLSDLFEFMQNSNLSEDEKDKVYELMQYLSNLMNRND